MLKILNDHIKSNPAFVYGLFMWLKYKKPVEILNRETLLFDGNRRFAIDDEFIKLISKHVICNELLRKQVVAYLSNMSSCFDQLDIYLTMSNGKYPNWEGSKNLCLFIYDYVIMNKTDDISPPIKRVLEKMPDWEWDEFRFHEDGQKIIRLFNGEYKNNPKIEKKIIKKIDKLKFENRLPKKYNILFDEYNKSS